MTREHYLMMRENGNFNIIYEYYKEKFDYSKHSPNLGIKELADLLLNLGYNINSIMERCVKHYDEKFGVVILTNKEGKIIKVS